LGGKERGFQRRGAVLFHLQAHEIGLKLHAKSVNKSQVGRLHTQVWIPTKKREAAERFWQGRWTYVFRALISKVIIVVAIVFCARHWVTGLK
jgi:hypothetical protein